MTLADQAAMTDRYPPFGLDQGGSERSRPDAGPGDQSVTEAAQSKY